MMIKKYSIESNLSFSAGVLTALLGGAALFGLCLGLALIANEYEFLKSQMTSAESEMATKTFLPETILVLGLLASVLLGTSAYYARRANARAAQLDIACQKLKSGEELLDVVVKHLPVGIFMADIEGRNTYLNEYGCSLIGVKREDVIGDGWAKYVHPDDLQDLLAKWQEAVRRLTEFHHEFRLQASDKVRPANRFYVHAIPLKNMAGEVTGFAGTLIETTQIKEYETALKNSCEQLERAQSFSKVMVCHVGLDGTWLKVPPTLSELLGYSESDLVGKPFKDVTHPEDFLSAWSQCEKLIGGEIKSFELEKRCIRKDWTVVWFYLNYSIVEDAHGKPLHFLAYIINIDDKKRVDELEDSRDRLRQLAVGIQSAQEDERTRIAREIHDDLGQALTLTRLGLAHIEERAVLLEPELSRNFRKLFKLIDDTMFAMRRIISGLRPPVLDDFGLTAAIDWHAGEFQAQTGIECELHLEVTESRMSAEMELTLFRIYQEAMTNVVRHAKAGKVVIVLRRQGGILELEINDDGCGIPQTNICKSSGILGMYERASLWGWELKVQGKPRDGTVVLVRIPILKDAPPANIRGIISP